MVEEEATWLLKMQHENLDLRKPIKLKKLIAQLKSNLGIFIRNDNGIIGHANLQRLGGVIELHTVVVDPELRGGVTLTNYYILHGKDGVRTQFFMEILFALKLI